jgi:hypothetical protein
MIPPRTRFWAAVFVVVGAWAVTPSSAQPPLAGDDRLLLEGFGIDAPFLARFVDGKPLDPEERTPLVSALAGLRQGSQQEFDHYSEKVESLKPLGAPEAKGRLWQVSGRLKSLTAEEFTKEELERIYAEVDDLPGGDPRRRMYRGEIELTAGAAPVTAYLLRVPKGLTGRRDLDERVIVEGVLLKNAGSAESPQPILAARRLAWYPRTPLGDLGVDYAAYDDVRLESHDLKNEREAFYQLLAGMQRADFAKLVAETQGAYSVVPLFNEPAMMHGKLIALQGTARRAVSVVVNEPDVVERFGIKRYYEVSMYTTDSQQNPMIVNVLELPPGMPEGENIHAAIRVPCTFVTGFYYHRDATPDEQARGIQPKLQKAPLLIGKSIQLIVVPKAEDSAVSWVFGGLVAAALLAVCFGVAALMRGEKRTRSILQRQMAPPPGTSLNDAPVEYHAKPDFSGLHDTPTAADDGGPKPGGERR